MSRLAPWVALGLLIVLAYTLAALSWRLWPVDNYPEPIIKPIATSSTSPKPILGLDQIASLHLFGRADSPVEVAPVTVSAPETRLNLSLKGLVAAASQQEARALIAQGSSSEEVYRVGQVLPGGATVHEIHPDRVILLRAGRFETLTLPKERMDIATPATVPAATGHTQEGGSSQVAGGVSQQLRELRDTLMQNPQDAMQFINAQPVIEDGQVRGYRVRPGRDRRLFNDVGLRPGDVVTAVNGISLSDPAQFGALFQQISSASTLNVTVDRRGRQTELNLNLE